MSSHRLRQMMADVSTGPYLTRWQNTSQVIGLWNDELFDVWSGIIVPYRADDEEEYYSREFHSALSYIDEDWSDNERMEVWSYLKRAERKSNIVINPEPIVLAGGRIAYSLCSDDKYLWHESLEDFVLLYHVRPPSFFVDHILCKDAG